jgi:hypothetical protein
MGDRNIARNEADEFLPLTEHTVPRERRTNKETKA